MSDTAKLFQTAKDRAKKSRASATLWPKQFSEDTWECAWDFCKSCRTWDESSGEVNYIPDLEYLQNLTREWHETRASGQPLGIEKSRRLVASWLLCALDVWDAGLRRCNIVEGGENYSKASDFVWRCWFIYDHLRDEFPQWKLPDPQTWGNTASQHLDGLQFVNESLITPLNSDGESFRGAGYTRVKLEELSSYRYVDEVLAQARVVTMGPAGKARGHVVFVCNASPNAEWQAVKEPPGGHGSLPNPKSEPYIAYTSRTGNRIVRVHFLADPEKNEAWAEKESVGVPKAKWAREMDLHDAESEDALWTQEMIDATRVYELPKNIVQVLVSVDPSVSDPEPKAAGEKNKATARKPDEVGIIVGALADNNHFYIIDDLSGDMSPLEWAQTAVMAHSKYGANRIIAEKNQGGELVPMTIHQVSPSIYIERVHASIGKRARAEPVVGAYELGNIHHLGVHKGLEQEMTTWSKRSNKSPGRIDALVQLIKAAGILENLAGGVADRFPHSDETELPDDFFPDEAFIEPYAAREQMNEPNAFANYGWS